MRSAQRIRETSSSLCVSSGYWLLATGYFFVAVMADGDVNLIVLPSTVPTHFWVPAVIVSSAPRSRPWTAWLPSVPDTIWKVSVSAPFGVFHVPATFAGTIQNSAVHQLLEQPSVTVVVSSACQSSIVKVFDAMRVPGFMSRSVGRSFMLIDGSRNIVITVAFVNSAPVT